MPLRFHFTGIVVADMARALAFYRSLGLDIPADADDQPHVEHRLEGGGLVVWDTEDTIRSFHPSFTPATGSPRVAFAFACDAPAEVDETHARLVDAGSPSHVEPFDAFWGQRYASVLDPDGNAIDLLATLG